MALAQTVFGTDQKTHRKGADSPPPTTPVIRLNDRQLLQKLTIVHLLYMVIKGDGNLIDMSIMGPNIKSYWSKIIFGDHVCYLSRDNEAKVVISRL